MFLCPGSQGARRFRKDLPRKGASAASSPLRTHPSSLWTQTSPDGIPASPSVVATSLCLERTIWDHADSGPVTVMGGKKATEAIIHGHVCAQAGVQGDARGPGPTYCRVMSHLDLVPGAQMCCSPSQPLLQRHKLIFQMKTPQLLHLSWTHVQASSPTNLIEHLRRPSA